MGVALASRPDVSSLAMVACYPTEEQAADLASNGDNPPETMHVTLVFLGEVDELDLEAARRAVASVAKETPPLSGIVSGTGVFKAGDDGHPQIVIPSVKGLSTLRTRVVDALAAEGIVSPSEYDWVPHMTLSYVDDPAIPDMGVIDQPLDFGSLSLTVADNRTDYEFTGQEELSTAANHFSRAEQRKLRLLVKEARSI